MFKNFAELLSYVKQNRKGTAIIAGAQIESAIEAGVMAKKEGLCESILVGDKPEIIRLIQQKAPDLVNAFEIIDTGSDLRKAAETAVALAKEEKGDLILKGKMESSVILKAALDKEKGLKVSEVISDVFVYEHPEGLKIQTDGGINILPELNEKIAIVKNAVQVAHALGNPKPKVAMVCAIETVNPKMPATIDAALIAKMNERGQIPGCIIEGPLAFDNAVDKEAARIKGLTSEVAGAADILVFPNIETGNVHGKMLTYYCHYKIAHVTIGTKVPILIPSRADSGETKMLCMALALATMS
ncbi:MAG: phosphate acyltransferase [Candidatus Cloacimonadota bacterium]|jgi:phosphate butyryltransferase|nr:phosphate acetyltransferase [Candidatus Cloacimonas sp.]MDI9571550.1 phosphate acyltransferase [Candidatus Cloacimonadota bacterium]HNV61942.1 phosphate acyltransferase [Candidatus Cloacimonas acidaminovorans]HPI42687.1 phosphate acyltransferase [Candidatus Cloacimonas acidaminovorans]HPX57393.1 phosphate acyltransferase [Candidatus Cloacimonas acidaminovorans]